MMGEAMDRGDKSINKAFSAAYKYLCLQVFCVPLEGESDDNSPEMVSTPINKEQVQILNDLFVARVSDQKAFKSHYKIDEIADLPSAVFLQAKSALEKKPLKAQDENS